MINTVLDDVLPGDKSLGMPPASKLDFYYYQNKSSTHAITDLFLKKLESISLEKFKIKYIELDKRRRMQVINTCKIKSFKIFSDFIDNCFKFYYSDRLVLSLINAGSSPPFPKGNLLKLDDWSIVEPVMKINYNHRVNNSTEK